MKKHDLTNTHLHRKSPGKALYAAFVGMTMAAMLCQPVFAATVWEKANEIMKDVYNQILLISTIAAIVTASVALLLMNFSRSGRTVDESRAWLKLSALHGDQEGVVEAVTVELGHGGEIGFVAFTLEKLLYAGFQPVGDLFHALGAVLAV